MKIEFVFKGECVGFYPDDDNPEICSHYSMGLCAFFEKNGVPIECDDIKVVDKPETA